LTWEAICDAAVRLASPPSKTPAFNRDMMMFFLWGYVEGLRGVGITANEGGRGDEGRGGGAKFGQSVSQSRGSESAESARRSLSPEKKTLKKQKQTKTPRLAGLFAPAAPSIPRIFPPFSDCAIRDSTRRSRRLRGLQGRARGDPGPTGARARARTPQRRDAAAARVPGPGRPARARGTRRKSVARSRWFARNLD
jgi:hypothetical protein